MDQHTLRQSAGAKRDRKRVGRGPGSGQGTYGGRGRKGQKARGGVRPGFEGGQIPLVRRVPHLRGFKNFTRVEFQAVNLGTLDERFPAGATIDGASLAAERLIDHAEAPFKVLNRGELTHAITISATRISEAAKAAITEAGGSFEELAATERTPRDRIHRRKVAVVAPVAPVAEA